jgi:hypothetical protein
VEVLGGQRERLGVKPGAGHGPIGPGDLGSESGFWAWHELPLSVSSGFDPMAFFFLSTSSLLAQQDVSGSHYKFLAIPCTSHFISQGALLPFRGEWCLETKMEGRCVPCYWMSACSACR